MRWILLFFILVSAGAGIALYQSWVRIPANWLPWKPVDLDMPPGWLVRFHVNSLSIDRPACFAALDRAALEYRRLDDRPIKDGCGLIGGVVIQKSHTPYSSAFQATCGMTAALYWFEQEVDLLAVFHTGARIAQIQHYGTYACRNVNSRETGRRSQHATANAIDIAGFKFSDGSSASVLRDWGKDTPQGRFLLDTHRLACRIFNVTLGPDYNALHANHFHLDLGRMRICR